MGEYGQKGCYSYKSGTYSGNGKIYYSYWGSDQEKSSVISHDHDKYRPPGFDCSGKRMILVQIRILYLKKK